MTTNGLLHRPENVTWHAGTLDRQARWQALGCRGSTIWLTGLSGSGKSTVGAAIEQALVDRRVPAYLLDGDNLRHGLNRDLGFDRAARRENVRRIAEVARILADGGSVVIVAAISPYAVDRQLARSAHAEAGLAFVEVFVDAPLSVCENRDPKGLYRKARAGRIASFTGVDDTYEAPMRPEVHLHTDELDVQRSVAVMLAHLARLSVDGATMPDKPTVG